MSLYRVTPEKLEAVPRTTFSAASLMERKDLQRFLCHDITPLGDDLLVVAEEFGDWQDSNRRIDLLCLNKEADLVVVEIKRTEDGGHMELQAIRYAAMVSSMTLEKVIEARARTRSCDAESARRDVLDFLQFEDEDEVELTGEVRIILVSADFSTELTTAVLWLNRKELDITCIRLRPYRMGEEILIDATQIIPLPEAADYEVKMREQEKEKKKVVSARHEIFRRFWAQTIERSKPRTSLLANRTTSGDHWLSAGIGRSGFGLNLVLNQQRGQVECYIRVAGGDEKSTAAFHALLARKEEIQSAFGGDLDWQELPGRHGCRICVELPGGWKAPETDWPEMQDRLIDTLIRFERALRKPIQEVVL
jgi:hypothetical protein